LRSQKQGNQNYSEKPKGSSFPPKTAWILPNVAPYAQLLAIPGILKTAQNAFRALLGIFSSNIAFAAVIFVRFRIVIISTSRAYRNLEIPLFRVF